MMVRRGEVLISNMTNLQFNLQNSASCPQQKVQNPSYKVGFIGGLWLGFWWIKNPFGLVFPCVFTFNQVEHTIPGRVAPSFKTLVYLGATVKSGATSRFGESFQLKLAKPSTEGTMPSDFALGLSLKEVHNKSEVERLFVGLSVVWKARKLYLTIYNNIIKVYLKCSKKIDDVSAHVCFCSASERVFTGQNLTWSRCHERKPSQALKITDSRWFCWWNLLEHNIAHMP